MNAIELIKRTLANYKGFANMQFPLDADGMSDGQLNDYLLSVLGNIGGDRYKIGCTVSTNYTGYVFLGTKKFPAGELLFVESGTPTGYLCIKEENENVTADGYDYNNAYTKRTMVYGAPGSGVESYLFSSFKDLVSNDALNTNLKALEEKVNAIVPAPVGCVMMWPGKVATDADYPDGWMPCDGRSLSRIQYAGLYSVIGTQYGSESSTAFSLPDLRGQFVMGLNKNDADYNQQGKKGGNKIIYLQSNQLPDFNLTIPGQWSKDNLDFNNFSRFSGGDRGEGDTNRMFDLTVPYARNKNAGQYGQPIDIRPQYFVLSYMIKVK